MDSKSPPTPVKVNINLDTTPILYTDNVLIGASIDGIVMDFCQKLGMSSDLRIVSRIGMSRDQAKKFYKTLGEQLSLIEAQSQSKGNKVN